ncbi:hypothetical protein NN6n1_23610 [Shinella zoogloeoides]
MAQYCSANHSEATATSRRNSANSVSVRLGLGPLAESATMERTVRASTAGIKPAKRVMHGHMPHAPLPACDLIDADGVIRRAKRTSKEMTS